jgi:hypothetical protein
MRMNSRQKLNIPLCDLAAIFNPELFGRRINFPQTTRSTVFKDTRLEAVAFSYPKSSIEPKFYTESLNEA